MKVLEDWHRVLKKAEEAEISLTLGETDTGKTTLVNFLHRKLGGTIVDSDIGQSDVGPPTTVALSEDGKNMLDGYFVGSTTPSRHIPEMVVATKRMVERARPPIFIDTTGLVRGFTGRTLKTQKIQAIDPDLIILLGDSELGYYHTFENVGIEVVGLPISEYVRSRSRSERRRARRKSFKEYFFNSKKKFFDLAKVGIERTVFGSGENISEQIAGIVNFNVHRAERIGEYIILVSNVEKLDPEETRRVKRRFGVRGIACLQGADFEDLLVGLVGRKNDFLGLGILEELSFDQLQASIRMPRNIDKRVALIQFGSIRVRRDGKEMGFVSLP